MIAESANVLVPRRRWFQFGLRTLFVLMTVVALWLAWELSFIRERQAWLRENAALVPDSTLDPALVAVNSQAAPPFAQVGATGATSGSAPSTAPNTTNGSVSFSFVTLSPPSPPREATIPFWRTMLGDTAVAEVTAPNEWTEAERAHTTRLFPEAELLAPMRDIGVWVGSFEAMPADASAANDSAPPPSP